MKAKLVSRFFNLKSTFIDCDCISFIFKIKKMKITQKQIENQVVSRGFKFFVDRQMFGNPKDNDDGFASAGITRHGIKPETLHSVPL